MSKDENFFFRRWLTTITPQDIEQFKRECLDPILENLCDWWSVMNGGQVNPFSSDYATHWRHPFGVYNPLNEGGASELDELLESGSTLGLERATTLFPELQ